MSSLVTAPERLVFGKSTRSGLDTRKSRPPASMIVASPDAAMPRSSTGPSRSRCGRDAVAKLPDQLLLAKREWAPATRLADVDPDVNQAPEPGQRRDHLAGLGVLGEYPAAQRAHDLELRRLPGAGVLNQFRGSLGCGCGPAPHDADPLLLARRSLSLQHPLERHH